MNVMLLKELGFNSNLEKFRTENSIDLSRIGRVIAEHKDSYIVKTMDGEVQAEITGNLRFSAKNREDLPAVGDWVILTVYDSDMAIIHQVFPRFSIIKRQSVGQFGEIQIIATNIDFAFIIQAIDRDLNINRLERFLTICYSSKVSPIILLTKIDLINEERILDITKAVKMRVDDVPIIPISNETQSGYDELKKFIETGKTYCLLGSSGVGKSTLLNNLSGKPIMKTDSISESTNKGRHVTSHRELTILENSGGILIDNPGMREVGIGDAKNGLDITFNTISNLAKNCKFKDCTHTSEVGCSVLEAIQKGELDKKSYHNYMKMEKEKIHFESTVTEKHKKEKIFGKIQKDFQKNNRKRNN